MSQDSVLFGPSPLQDFGKDLQPSRPSQVAKSFSRFEPPSSGPSVYRSQDMIPLGSSSEAPTPEVVESSTIIESGSVQEDIFAKPDPEDAPEEKGLQAATSSLSAGLAETFDSLPIELISLTDRFIDSLTDKVYTTPPSIEKLANLFQDFYVRAGARISTHISTLSFRQYRGNSPNTSLSSRSSSTATLGNRVRSRSSKESLKYEERPGSEQQMLTTTEIVDKRKARRLLEQKRHAMEEAVEKRACEAVYDRIWRHRSTLDEVRDEKLRSRTAALSLVGIGLGELGVDTDLATVDIQPSVANGESQVREWFAGARDNLMRMNDEKYPLGKLQYLAAAHKSIVDVLSKFQTSSSSADEILPTMIYTLLTTPAEGINVISNLHFIQRFRAANKVDGEAAYCLTNLEAAISFLETVDLASLRADEVLEGPTKPSSRPPTPPEKKMSFGPLRPSSPSLSEPVTTPAVGTYSIPDSTTVFEPLPSAASSRPSPPTSPLHQRRLSHLLQPSTNAIGAASDAVRTTADQGFRNISNTLDNSFRFLFGRLKEQEMSSNGNSSVLIPRTLDDARKLVSSAAQVEDNGNISGASSIAEQRGMLGNRAQLKEDKVLGLISGHKQTRERSVDSTQSNGSGQRVSSATSSGQVDSSAPLSTSAPPAPSNAALESMRNLGNTLNPLNRLAGINVMRGFGRTASNTPPAVPASAEKNKELGASSAKVNPEPISGTVPAISPPISRFMEVDGPGDLKITEVADLLEDYRRLARALKDSGAF